MNCSEVCDNLVMLLRNELSDQEAGRIRTHLEGCRECSLEMEALAATIGAVDASGAARPPAYLRAAVLAAVEVERVGPLVSEAVPKLPDPRLRQKALAAATDPEAPEPRFTRRPTPLFAVAAALAILFAIGGWLRIQSLEGDIDRLRERAEAATTRLGPEGHEMQTFALDTPGGPVDGLLTHFRHDNYRLTLDVGSFEVTPPETYYAVWLRGQKGDVAIGTFRLKATDRFVVNFAAAVDPVDYPEVLVTLEPDDGDPRLNGEVVATGMLDTAKIHHGDYEE